MFPMSSSTFVPPILFPQNGIYVKFLRLKNVTFEVHNYRIWMWQIRDISGSQL